MFDLATRPTRSPLVRTGNLDNIFSTLFKNVSTIDHRKGEVLLLNSSDDSVTYAVNVAGFDKENINMTYHDDYLRVQATNNDVGYEQIDTQWSVGKINPDNIETHIQNGILKISISGLKKTEEESVGISIPVN